MPDGTEHEGFAHQDGSSSSSPRTGQLLVVSGPGGVGKGTVVAELVATNPDIRVSLSATTRPPRQGERDGVHYRFMDAASFRALIDAGGFLEWAEFNGRLYGTPWTSVTDPLEEGATLVLEIDVQGAEQVMARHAAGLLDHPLHTVFLAPPSWEVLEERLRKRGSEDETSIAQRLAIGEQEMAARSGFQHVLVNDRVDAAVAALERILGRTD